MVIVFLVVVIVVAHCEDMLTRTSFWKLERFNVDETLIYTYFSPHGHTQLRVRLFEQL